MTQPLYEHHLAWKSAHIGNEVLTAIHGEVAVIRLHRPAVRNALSNEVFTRLTEITEQFDEDEAVAAIVLTGGGSVFAAGSDVREFAGKSPADIHGLPRLDEWHRLRRIRKPLIAAVNGPALGGGCELAMVCDIIIAGESAIFGQPEINLGLIPGGGGTQRLIRAVGKSIAMDMILSGRTLTARDAHRFGLVARLAPNELVLDRAISLGEVIAAKPRASVARAKQAVLFAESAGIAEGIEQERRLFECLFGTPATQEGMRAFLEKRAPSRPGNAT